MDAEKENVSRELSAGGIVFRRVGGGIEFAMIKDPFGKWTFPKGHVETGEDIEEAAARETLEELGLMEIRLLEYLGKIDIWFRDQFKSQNRLVHKDIHFYLFETQNHMRLKANPSEHVYEAKWVPASEVESLSDYEDMVPIVKNALKFVMRSLQN
jgi:8-oxo-dGTP pyrophosphatase MutT (NUDIX family)